MADDFMLFLAGGLAIIGILVVVFGAGCGQFGCFASASTPQPTGKYYTSPVFVGRAEFETVETLYTHFDANNYIQTNVYSVGSRRITNGLLFGLSSVKVDLGNSEYTTVSFDVTSTNKYGAVLIKVDENIIVKQLLDEGHYEFTLPAGRYIEIMPENSEWRIWAPAVYDLQNLKVTASSYPKDGTSFTFGLENLSEIESVRLDFHLNSNAGLMVIKLNGDVVYDGAVNNDQSVYIDKSRLDDVNILSFSAREDSKFDGRAVIAITRKTMQFRPLFVDINMTQDEYNRFNHGTVEFDVTSIMRPGGYSVTIENNGEILMKEYVKLETGYFVMNVAKDNLRPGLNMFIVTPVEDSAFLVQGLTTHF